MSLIESKKEMTVLDRLIGGVFVAIVAFGMLWLINLLDTLELSLGMIGAIASGFGLGFALFGVRLWDWMWEVLVRH